MGVEAFVIGLSQIFSFFSYTFLFSVEHLAYFIHQLVSGFTSESTMLLLYMVFYCYYCYI